MANLLDLTGKTAKITGSSRGIGKAIAHRMAEHGDTVVVSSRKADACEAAVKEINQLVGRKAAISVPANIAVKEALQHLVDETRKAFGQIDILVCNAASNPYAGPMAGIADEQFEKIFHNNVLANHWLTQMVAPQMLERKDGAILIISSIGGLVAQTSFGAFVCSLLRDTLGADGCVFNGGGIRAGRAYTKHVTYGDIKAELPFDNEIVVARMPGAVVRAAVVASRSHLPLEFGGFLQVDDRMHLEGDAPTIAGAAFEADREYRIAIVRNLFEGMDRIDPLVAFAKAFPEKPMADGAGRE